MKMFICVLIANRGVSLRQNKCQVIMIDATKERRKKSIVLALETNR